MSIVLRRQLPARVLLYASLLILACSAGLAVAAQPCSGDTPALELRIVATGIAPDLDRTTVVSVHDDGCTRVHRPGYRRDAGEYRLDLGQSALAALRSRVDRPALRSFDAKRVRSELATANAKRADASTTQQSEQDADYYELRWNSAGKTATAGWSGLPAAALQNAGNTTLQEMAAAAQALQALTERSDAMRIEGGTP